jgi:hypothetical protein
MPVLVIQRLIAAVVFILTFYEVYNYPYASVFLGIILIIYSVLSLIKPAIWLLVIPAVLPILSLAPWSGRFFLEEFDFFIWITVATALLRGDYSFNRARFALLPTLLVAFLFATHSIALIRGLMPFTAIDVNSFNNYHSPYYALRVGKAFYWAILLIPPLIKIFNNQRSQAQEYLGIGVSTGLFGTGLAILWERGVFLDLIYGTNKWERLQSLTNFSSEFRATGLLADMHTGGEAIDGYLALAWPFALGLLITHKSTKSLLFGFSALPLGLYSALVTFSRGTYMAVAVSLASFGLAYTNKFSIKGLVSKSILLILATLLAAIASCIYLYGKGGILSLFAALTIFAGTTLLMFFRLVRLEIRLLAIGGLFLFGSIMIMRGLLTSAWIINSWEESLGITLLVSFIMLLTGLLIGKQARQFMSIKELLSLVGVATIVLAVCVPIASGSYIKSRFSTASGDLSGRVNHWKHAIDLMNPTWGTTAFGMGLGVFPRAYAWDSNLASQEKTSMIKLATEPFKTFLKLSESLDLTLGQRIHLEANQKYTLSVDVRAQAKQGAFGASICRRNILYPTTWNPTCIYYEQPVPAGTKEWQKLMWTFNVGDLGDGGKIGRHPLILRISNGLTQNQYLARGIDKAIDVDNIKLQNQLGEDVLVNGNFEHELDRWYIYTDLYHLPLHIKNLWVTAFFEQGLFGLLAFGSLGFYTLYVGVKLASRGDHFANTLLASLLGFFMVGLIGTLLDVPRVSFLFFLLQFALLAQDPAQFAKVKQTNRH